VFTLRADPWMPEYGMGFDVRFDELPAVVDPTVEVEDWSQPLGTTTLAPEPVSFIDGIRRIELRLLADVDGVRVPGLFGSYAAGAVVCDGEAAFSDHLVAHCIIVGGGAKVPSIEVRFGSGMFRFETFTTPGSEPDDPLLRLQDLMRQAEAELAARLAADRTTLVVVDGPLAFYGETRGPVVGVIKRFGRVYLTPEHGHLIPKLRPGQRTPLFAISGESDRRRRYAWYTRLASVRSPWHDHAGVVRCEVRGGMRLVDAAELANRVSALLPLFIGRASDPRTPQNLAPIAGLESWLRHRAGDTRLIRRALLDWIATREVAA
jgi:hypothetical protein